MHSFLTLSSTISIYDFVQMLENVIIYNGQLECLFMHVSLDSLIIWSVERQYNTNIKKQIVVARKYGVYCPLTINDELTSDSLNGEDGARHTYVCHNRCQQVPWKPHM